jgi:triacylglycerol lipase
MHPIVLVHGFFGYRHFLLWSMFAGVEECLIENGFNAYYPQQHPTDKIENRAQQLLDSIQNKFGNDEPVHLICHSMGGLDSRYLASPNGLNQGHRIRTITTLSTPHHGSSLASRIPETARALVSIIAREGKHLLQGDNKTFVSMLGENHWEGLAQLTPEYINEQFNPQIVDHPDVQYFSYAGKVDYSHPTLFDIPRIPAWKYMFDKEGDNDGMVSIESAKWGEFKGVLNSDHGSLIGLCLFPWMKCPFNHLDFFVSLANDLQELD